MAKPLFWHQGLFLQPHHFQRENLYFQSLLTPFHRYMVPYFWGVGELTLPKVVAGNAFDKIHKGYLIFPDQTYVTYPGNALIQAREFGRQCQVTGLVLTKLDGTGKGGVVVAIRRELGYPERFVVLGERLEDLQPFAPELFARALFE